MVELPIFYLESTVPTAACKMAIVFRSAGYACFIVSHLFEYDSPSKPQGSGYSESPITKKIIEIKESPI